MIGLYIHVPFCKRKCPYCDFYSVEAKNDELLDAYVYRLLEEADGYKSRGVKVDSVYFGGGTPSLLSQKQIDKVLNGLNKCFYIDKNAEVTAEVNPSSADYNKLLGYIGAGINRISFGIQSSSDRELNALGRLHNFKQANNAVYAAKKAGFENISADIMIALPGQTGAGVEKSVEDIINLGVQHISCYILKVEDNTPYAKMNLSLPDDDECADMYLRMCDILKSSGFDHYEISNFSKPGYESRHNLKYWRAEEYIGLGVSSHSYFDSVRYFNKRDLPAYLNGDNIRVTEDMNIDKAKEYLMLSLRLSEGISVKKYLSLGGGNDIYLKSESIGNRFLKIHNDNISLTEEGFLVSNEIISRLL